MIRRALIAGALAAGIIGVIPSAPAQAKLGCGVVELCEWTYYPDPGYSNSVGQQIWECNGTFWQWGQQTSYVTFYESPCT